jgi:hypothetical protein
VWIFTIFAAVVLAFAQRYEERLREARHQAYLAEQRRLKLEEDEALQYVIEYYCGRHDAGLRQTLDRPVRLRTGLPSRGDAMELLERSGSTTRRAGSAATTHPSVERPIPQPARRCACTCWASAGTHTRRSTAPRRCRRCR